MRQRWQCLVSWALLMMWPAVTCLAAGTPAVEDVRKALEESARAGNYEPAAITEALLLLDNKQSRNMSPKDTVRICDMVAAALEHRFRMNYSGVRNLYWSGPVQQRNKSIAIWKQWCAKQLREPDPHPRETYVGRLLGETLTRLKTSPDSTERARMKARLKSALGTAFCLTDLPGVDAAAGPSALRQWRIMRVAGEDRWRKFTKSWSTLQTAFDRKFLPTVKGKPLTPQEQAAAFVEFVEKERRFKGKWLWDLCRNCVETHPRSPSLAKIKAVQKRAEQELKSQYVRVALHGDMPVAEPCPGPPAKHDTMQPDGATALALAVNRNPSDLSIHKKIIAHPLGTASRTRDYVYYEQLRERYPANEVLCLANAEYQVRVRSDLKRALEFATKALILNPRNATARAMERKLRNQLKGK